MMRRGIFVCVFLPPVCLILAAVLFFAAVSVSLPVSAEADGGEVAVLMYHSILRDPDMAGDYVISPAALEEDFRWLAESGYVSITASEAAELSKSGGLPEKAVIITFDDGFLNVLTYALPLLEKYDLKAVVAVVGQYSERFSVDPDPNPAYAYLSWGEIAELAASGRVEIANHSYAMHTRVGRMGSARKHSETDDAYREAFCADVLKTQQLLKDNCGITPTTFVYPFGAVGEGSEELLSEMGFTCALTCLEQINYPSQSGAPLVLGRFNRPSGPSTENFMEKAGLGR